jgi:outer membrane protein TolC
LAKAELLKSIAQKRSKFHLLEIDLKNAYLELQQKEKLLWRAEKEERSANQIVFLTKSNVDIGIGDKKEYLEALQSHLLIQAAVFENIYNYNVAVANLKQKLGLLYKREDMNSPSWSDE